MIFLKKTYLNKYVYSPYTKYHKINPYIKIYIIYSILNVGLYINIYKIILIIGLVFTLLNRLFFPKYLKIFELNITINYSLYLIYTCILNQISEYLDISNNNIIIYQVFLPYYLKIKFKHFIYRIKYFHISYYLQKYMIKTMFIYILYSIILEVIFIFTRYQIILEIFIGNFNKINLLQSIRSNIYNLNLFLGYKFLERMITKLSDTTISLKIKRSYLTNYFKLNLKTMFFQYYNFIINEENSFSLTIWNRNIKKDYFKNIKYFYY
uniref:Uncharacterized protein n=1 Tax=Chondria tumulosa TaxID=2740715 RepID=A0A896SPV2_9FLOR|nr:hypothetical protein K8K75_pgp115 [Chondria tumulosa]QSD57092.1 hypothetical protein [Chondria tumulosa]